MNHDNWYGQKYFFPIAENANRKKDFNITLEEIERNQTIELISSNSLIESDKSKDALISKEKIEIGKVTKNFFHFDL